MLSANGLFPVIVVARHDEASDVVSLELSLPDSGDLPAWAPGAHIDIAVDEAGVRQYSLCGDPDDRRRWRVGVLLDRNGRGGSRYLHREAVPGSTLTVSLPRNNFALIESASYVFIAGGIGVTPILPMVAAAEAAGADWTLFYGGRSRDSMAYLREIEGYGPRVQVLPQDEHGLLPLGRIRQRKDSDTSVYCCGPESLLSAVEAEFVPGEAGRLHLERFAPRAFDDRGDTDGGFDLELARTGMTIRVDTGQSIVEALEKSGIAVETSCREGTCASCETTVLGGEVDHRDSILSDHEREQNASMMLCVSRAQSKLLVLDL